MTLRIVSHTSGADHFIASCESWKVFQISAAALSIDRRVEAFSRLTQILLQTDSVYRNALVTEDVWLRKSVPAEICNQLRLPPEGVDIVARTRDNGFWLVRSAFVAPGERDLDSQTISRFNTLAFDRCKGISHALVVHNADNEIDTTAPNVGQIGSPQWHEIAKEQWDRIVATASGQQFKRIAKDPRQHQLEAVSSAEAHFRVNTRGRLNMPCGTGKSLTGLLISKALDARTIVIAAPSLSLIRQNLIGWSEQFDAWGDTFDCLCVQRRKRRKRCRSG